MMKISFVNSSLSDIVLKEGEITFLKHDLSATSSDRFWKSVKKILKINSKLFNYFSDEEVFSRVIEKTGNASFKFCIEEGEENIVLAMSRLDTAVPSLQEIIDRIMKRPIIDSGYHKGEVKAVYDLENIASSRDNKRFLEQCERDYIMEYTHHVDILNDSSIVLGIQTENGPLLFEAPLLTLSFEPEMNQFTQGQGRFFSQRRYKKQRFSAITALEHRLDIAGQSACSLNDIAGLFKILVKEKITLERFDQLLNFPFEKFGLPTHNSLSSTRLSKIPTELSVEDFFLVAAAARKASSPVGKKRIDKYVGKLITSYYDFENCTYQELLSSFKGEEPQEEKTLQDSTNIESVDLSILDEDLSNVVSLRKEIK